MEAGSDAFGPISELSERHPAISRVEQHRRVGRSIGARTYEFPERASAVELVAHRVLIVRSSAGQ
jgi:hypothetical protein